MTAVTVDRRARARSWSRRARPRREAAPANPAVRILTFSALGLYGALRWSTLVAPAATWRMLALLALAVTAAGVLGALAERNGRSRLLAGVGVLVLIVVAFPVCGVPLTLLVHHHFHTIGSGISLGLTALPRVLVPYAGANEWARTVILLGGGVLLLDAGVLLAFVPASLGDGRRAAAALPLIALAVVPSALEVPHASVLQGLLLFVLVAAFVWGERLGRRELVPALAVASLAGLAGLAAAPRLDIHHPLVNYQSIANSLSPGGLETLQWYQGYGPYTWPQGGQSVVDVTASHPEFWKTENLDEFDGRGWVEAEQGAGNPLTPPPVPAPSPLAAAAWTQTLQVTIGKMSTSDVIVAGTAQAPQNVPGGVTPAASPGTWVANRPLGPGDVYAVRVYTPNPTPVELEDAGLSYPTVLDYYREMFLPAGGAGPALGTIVFPAFGSAGAPASFRPPSSPFARAAATDAASVAASLNNSPYGPAYRLARTLAAGAATPYAFVVRVESYLRRHYTYDTNAPVSPYPIETFLFKDRYGYCQHFAGAMALLLRMGGIPARVAVGFTPGESNSTTGAYRVVDTDAHSWVEVWFPNYGWVAFNPTPSSTPGSSGPTPDATLASNVGAAAPSRVSARKPSRAARHHGGSELMVFLLPALVLLLGLAGGTLALGVRGRRRGRNASSDELVAELERALRRCDIHISPATTLAHLERRFEHSPEAAAYVRTVGRGRYAGVAETPTPEQRRALRKHLAAGGGTRGRLRALWSLPPWL